MDGLMLLSPSWTSLLALSFCCRWGFGWISKQATAPELLQDMPGIPVSEKEPAGIHLPPATLHTWVELAIRYGWLAAETVPKGRNACPLSLQTLALSCAGPLLGPEEDPAAERAGWE